jgi:hypothetical protein
MMAVFGQPLSPTPLAAQVCFKNGLQERAARTPAALAAIAAVEEVQANVQWSKFTALFTEWGEWLNKTSIRESEDKNGSPYRKGAV